MTEKISISSERLADFNEIFRKDVTCDTIKSHKKQGFTLSLIVTFLKKSQGVNLTPPASLGLSFLIKGNLDILDDSFLFSQFMIKSSSILVG